MKRYVWGFPGIGKSHLVIPELRIVDADSQLFQFHGVKDEDLHSAPGDKPIIPNYDYPDNYIEYIRNVDADVVFINCHLSLLDALHKDDILIVYPSLSLKDEYLSRYIQRGDDDSFCNYMADEWAGMIDYIESSNFDRYKVISNDIYLSDLFERKDFKMKLMTRNELIEQLQRAKDLDVLYFDDDERNLVCYIYPGERDESIYGIPAENLADDVFNGKYGLDIDHLMEICTVREQQISKEKEAQARRGGLTRAELEDKIMQGIVNGALGIRYSEIAPYSHGYEVTLGKEGTPLGSTRDYINRWECYCGLFDIPATIVKKIEEGKQNSVYRGKSVGEFDIKEMLSYIDEAEKFKITSFVLEKDSGLKPRRGYDGHVASVQDVHYGKALDGIVKHHFHGTYSTMTPVKQNELVEALVFLKGFCLDCLYDENLRNPVSGIRGEDLKGIVNYLQKHGTDISTPDKLREWIKANPDKCGKEENRIYKLSFEEKKILYGQAFKDVVELNKLVNEFKGSLEELCTKLGGQNFDGELFDVNYGVIAATIELEDGVLVLNQNSVDIWDDPAGGVFEQSISVRELKVVCKQYGIDVGDKPTFDREGHVFNDEQKLFAQAYCDFVELKALVSNYGHSFDVLCDRLGGDRYNDDIFRLDYGVISVSISRDNGGIFRCESAIDVWNEVSQEFLDDCMSFKKLKNTCEEIGFNTKDLDSQVLGSKTETEKPGLDSVIKSCEKMNKFDGPKTVEKDNQCL